MSPKASWFRKSLLVLSLVQMASVCTAEDEPKQPAASIPDVRMEPVMDGRTFREPVQVLAYPGDTSMMVVVERSGRVYSAPLAGGDPVELLDLRSVVTDRNSEEGLLSLAFHPDFPATPQLYVWYSTRSPRQTVLARYTVGEGKIKADSGERLLAVDQPYWNHNGGTVLFGPDGMLYLSLGDGGSANDPQGHGQNLGTLLGTVLRLDVSRAGTDTPYVVPPDNPFVNTPGARPEIWAYGLRNVWRMSFDPKTGELWGGDVGQNAWEEVDIITKGGNYGWNVREGKHAFRGALIEGRTAIEPISEYGREKGGSITGGEVVRDSGGPLDGVYLYSDYMTGIMWGLRRNADGTVLVREVLRGRQKPVSSFGRGADGAIYVAAFDAPYQKRGRIYRLVGPSS